MDKALPSNGVVQPGISIRNGPVEETDTVMTDVNEAPTNGHTKRKARESLIKPSYAEADSTDDDEPLVRVNSFSCPSPQFLFDTNIRTDTFSEQEATDSSEDLSCN